LACHRKGLDQWNDRNRTLEYQLPVAFLPPFETGKSHLCF
jgi:hypothetical protein